MIFVEHFFFFRFFLQMDHIQHWCGGRNNDTKKQTNKQMPYTYVKVHAIVERRAHWHALLVLVCPFSLLLCIGLDLLAVVCCKKKCIHKKLPFKNKKFKFFVSLIKKNRVFVVPTNGKCGNRLQMKCKINN